MVRPTKHVLRLRSRQLKKKATKSELMFRGRLINSGIAFQFQLVIGFYITDFFIHKKALIIELDGGVHNDQKEYDARRDQWLSKFGFTIWRIKNEDAATFDLTKIAALPKGKNVTNMFHQANIARNKLLAEQIRNEPEPQTIWIRKETHKSGFMPQIAPLTNWKKNRVPTNRTIKVIKKKS